MDGETHKAARKTAGFTQADYARLTGEARVSISDRERGRYDVPRWSALLVSILRDVPGAREYAESWRDDEESG